MSAVAFPTPLRLPIWAPPANKAFGLEWLEEVEGDGSHSLAPEWTMVTLTVQKKPSVRDDTVEKALQIQLGQLGGDTLSANAQNILGRQVRQSVDLHIIFCRHARESPTASDRSPA